MFIVFFTSLHHSDFKWKQKNAKALMLVYLCKIEAT